MFSFRKDLFQGLLINKKSCPYGLFFLATLLQVFHLYGEIPPGTDTHGAYVSYSNASQNDLRWQPQLALRVEQGASPTSLMMPGLFQANVQGWIKLPRRLKITFSCFLMGKLTFKLNEKSIFEVESKKPKVFNSKSIRLKPGEHKISIAFKSAEDGSGLMKFYWESRTFPKEPIPMSALRPESTKDQINTLKRLRKGRTLLSRHMCLKCHDTPALNEPTGMAELQADAPNFSGIGSRLRQSWLEKWLQNPTHYKKDAIMPQLLSQNEKQGSNQARDIATFLLSLQVSNPWKETPAGDPLEGEDVFRKLGCIQCHHFKPIFSVSDQRLSLIHINEKYQKGALYRYLKSPSANYKWTRMPDFKLSDKQAQNLSAYLRIKSPANHDYPPTGNLAKGKKLIATLGCLNCHPSSLKNLASFPPLNDNVAEWTEKGCLSENNPAPLRLQLNENEKRDLQHFAKDHLHTLSYSNPEEFALRQLDQLQCHQCHAVFNRPGQWGKYFESNIEAPPELSWPGEKLNGSYLSRLFKGDTKNRVRPWLKTSMPTFKSRASLLARGLVALHGNSILEEEDNVDTSLVEYGKVLLGEKGFSCQTCHDMGGQKASQVFEIKGPNLQYATSRLRKEYYMRWMLLPSRYVKANKMPQYATRGKTALKEPLNGDAFKQFDAIWHYLSNLKPDNKK